jgi:cysteinyl-tRNA synthetase
MYTKFFDDLFNKMFKDFSETSNYSYSFFQGYIGDKSFDDPKKFQEALKQTTQQKESKNLIDQKIATIKQYIEQLIKEDTPESLKKAALKHKELTALESQKDEYQKLLDSKNKAVEDKDYDKASEILQEMNDLLGIQETIPEQSKASD